MNEKRVARRNVAIIAAALCIVLLIGLVGAIIEIGSRSNDKDAEIARLKTQVSTFQNLFVKRAVEFLLNVQFNESMGLCREAPNAVAETYWLVSDNLWAMKALEMANKSHVSNSAKAGAVAAKIKTQLNQFAISYRLPKDSNDLPISYAHEAVVGDVALPPYQTTTNCTLHQDGYVLNITMHNGTVMDDWYDYSDLLLYAALSLHWEGSDLEALSARAQFRFEDALE